MITRGGDWRILGVIHEMGPGGAVIIWPCPPVIVKYGRHVRHNFEMPNRESKHCQTFCPAVVNVVEMSSRESKVCRTFSNGVVFPVVFLFVDIR